MSSEAVFSKRALVDDDHRARQVDQAARASVLHPSRPEPASALGIYFSESGANQRGLYFFRIAARLAGSEPSTWSNMALGYLSANQRDTALEAIKHVVALCPGDYAAVISVVRYLVRDEFRFVKFNDAFQYCRWGTLLDPLSSEAFFRSGYILKKFRIFDSALRCLFKSIVLYPSNFESLGATGEVLSELSQFAASQKTFEWAFRSNPDDYDSLYLLSLTQLRLGMFELGWKNYEYRWRARVGLQQQRVALAVRSSKPEYRGGYTARRLLVWGEQGIGDEIMFGSLLAEFRRNSEELLVQLDPRLRTLFCRSLPSIRFFGFDAPPSPESYDEQLALGSLGSFVRPTQQSFLNKGEKYLFAAPGMRAKLRHDLKLNEDEFLVGVCWRALNQDNQKIRSISLHELLSSLNFGKLSFLNLQYGNVEHEVSSLDQGFAERFLRHPIIDLTKDLDGVAGLIEACDLVVSVGNTVAHLSGALGQKTWVLLPCVAGWRWSHTGASCGWYKSARLFRQERRDDWSAVLASLREGITDELSESL